MAKSDGRNITFTPIDDTAPFPSRRGLMLGAEHDFELSGELAAVPRLPLADEIAEAVRSTLGPRFDRMAADAIFGTDTSSNTQPPQPASGILNPDTLAKVAAECVFAADIVITNYATTPGADGKPCDAFAYAIENDKMPDWDTRCAFARARGQPEPNRKTLIFPNAANVWAAIDAARAAGKDKP